MDTDKIKLEASIDELAEFVSTFKDQLIPPIRELREAISDMDTVLKPFLPTVDKVKNPNAIQFAKIYQDDFCNVIIFGLMKRRATIPLHHNPHQYSAIKVLKGEIVTYSFSKKADHSSFLLADCDGLIRYKAGGSNSVGHIEPGKRDVRKIAAVEPETFFMQVFVSKTSPFNYYKMPNHTLVAGQKGVELQRITCPSWYNSEKMDIPSVEPLEKN